MSWPALPARQRVQVNADHIAAQQPPFQQGGARAGHGVQHRLPRLGQAFNEVAGEGGGELGGEGVNGVQGMGPGAAGEGQVLVKQKGQSIGNAVGAGAKRQLCASIGFGDILSPELGTGKPATWTGYHPG